MSASFHSSPPAAAAATSSRHPAAWRFTWRSFGILLLALVSLHTFGDAFYKLADHVLHPAHHPAPHPAPDGWTWGLLFLGLGLALPLGRHVLNHRLAGDSPSWLFKLMAIAGLPLFAYAFHAIVGSLVHSLPLLALGSFACLLLCHHWKEHIVQGGPEIHALEDQEERHQQLNYQPPQHAVVLVSPHNIPTTIHPAAHSFAVMPKARPGEAAPAHPLQVTVTQDGAPASIRAALRDAERQLEARPDLAHYNWMQLIRCFTTEGFGLIPRITLIGSAQGYLDEAACFLRLFWPSPATIIHTVEVPRFAEITPVLHAVEAAIAEGGVDSARVVVDITGGFGITSVGAAAATLHSSALLQWVPTGNARQARQKNFLYDIRARREVSLE